MGRPRKEGVHSTGGSEEFPSVAVNAQDKPDTAKVKVGDIVMYAHRRTAMGSDGNDFVMIPMIVTRVYFDSLTIAGVVFSDNPAICANGSKIVNSTQHGEGGGNWKWRE